MITYVVSMAKADTVCRIKGEICFGQSAMGKKIMFSKGLQSLVVHDGVFLVHEECLIFIKHEVKAMTKKW